MIAFSVAMSLRYGPRALDAVVTPLAVVLVAATVAAIRLDPPGVQRQPIADGPVGASRTVTIVLESDRSVPVTIRDAAGDGVAVVDEGGSGTGRDAFFTETALESGETRVEYELSLLERGVHEVGPLSVIVQDTFGLVARRFEYGAGDGTRGRVNVYPRPISLRGDGVREFRALVESAGGAPGVATSQADRDEFDHLREYRRGDSLRDVHWKSAAKRPDDELVVTEYATPTHDDAVTIAVDFEHGSADELATAAASVIEYLLESELRVGLQLGADSDRCYQPDAGREHRLTLLRSLSVLEADDRSHRPPETDANADADVLVVADDEGTRVVVDGRTIPFQRLVDIDDVQRSTLRSAGGTDTIVEGIRSRSGSGVVG
ncbi:hypothetical protein C446_13999 [Halobiforma nitratireducens JCM 10879]|uniref:DUF58 domain-containing protein n=1 Tax=Halobiforma nitratireducens JCM 10879 TaxID=1227454 RepID=M0LJW5_9EURY|nr:hypothetical protein C446_13999 [Halobiforma nitratireducens JCM 10879]